MTEHKNRGPLFVQIPKEKTGKTDQNCKGHSGLSCQRSMQQETGRNNKEHQKWKKTVIVEKGDSSRLVWVYSYLNIFFNITFYGSEKQMTVNKG